MASSFTVSAAIFRPCAPFSQEKQDFLKQAGGARDRIFPKFSILQKFRRSPGASFSGVGSEMDVAIWDPQRKK